MHGQEQVRDVLHPGAGAERAGVNPGSGHGAQDGADGTDAGLVPGGERGGQPGRDHTRAAGDRAVEQVTASCSDLVPESGLAVHVDGAHLDVDGARSQRGQGAGRPADDLLDVFGAGQDRQQHVGAGRDLGRAAGDGAARLLELGRAAAAVTGDGEAALDQVLSDQEAHLAEADHADSDHADLGHRCLLTRSAAAIAKLYAVWALGSSPFRQENCMQFGWRRGFRPAGGVESYSRGNLDAVTFARGVCANAVGSGRMLAMPRVVQIPDIRKVDLPEARQAIPYVHAYLRECILDGTLSPGTKLSQVSLAAQLGISRTPLREVLRMLQEEGLVEIEPNQRTRVAGLDPAELDDIYASRILLETLALSMTIGHFGAKARAEAKRLLTTMRRAAKNGDFDAWFTAHTEYHRVCTAAAGETMQRQLRAFADRTTRYIRIYQLSEPNGWQAAGDVEHAAILEALIAGDEQGALTEMAHHLARTALRVLTDCAPDYVPVAVPHAVSLIDRQPPTALRLTGAS